MTDEQFDKILDLADAEQQTLVIHTDEDRRAVVVPYDRYEHYWLPRRRPPTPEPAKP